MIRERGTRREFRPLGDCWRDWLFAACVVALSLAIGSCLELLAFLLFDLPPAVYLK